MRLLDTRLRGCRNPAEQVIGTDQHFRRGILHLNHSVETALYIHFSIPDLWLTAAPEVRLSDPTHFMNYDKHTPRHHTFLFCQQLPLARGVRLRPLAQIPENLFALRVPNVRLSREARLST
jgi:hypothetical protein